MKKNLEMYLLVIVGLMGEVALAGPPAVHGMVIFGKFGQYASHLPMFHAPHDAQVLLNIKMDPVENSMALVRYQYYMKSGAKLFTLEPEPMDLAAVTSRNRAMFLGKLYLGHFEQGGKFIGPVKVTVNQVIYKAKLDSNPAPLAHEENLVFGSHGEYFLLHLVKERPSYDLIASVTKPKMFDNCSGRRVCDDLEDISSPFPLVKLIKTEKSHSTEAPWVTNGVKVLPTLDLHYIELNHVVYFSTQDLKN